jgi:hypothetical protein
MAEPHVVGALRRKRADLAGTVLQLEKRLTQERANLTHLDATMRLFDAHSRPEEIRPRARFLQVDSGRHGRAAIPPGGRFSRRVNLKISCSKQSRRRSAWFRQGECLRLIYDQLRGASEPMTTRELTERIMRVKAMPATDDHRRELVQKTILGSLNRAKQTITRVENAGVVSWRLA